MCAEFTHKTQTKVLCEEYNVVEIEDSVFIEGVAITFGKPTRNRVSYTYDSGRMAHKSLEGKPFLDTHHDDSIRKFPPFGHVCNPKNEIDKKLEGAWLGTNPKNGLPCLWYRANLDKGEEWFIRKLRRKDIPGVSVQVAVDKIVDKEDSMGSYIEANIREFLELSGVLIPGDGDSSIRLIESYNKYKESTTQVAPLVDENKIYTTNPKTPADSEPEEEEENPKPTTLKRLISMELEELCKEVLGKMNEFLEVQTLPKKDIVQDSEDKEKDTKESKKMAEAMSMTKDEIMAMVKQAVKEELAGIPERKDNLEKKDVSEVQGKEIPGAGREENGESMEGKDVFEIEDKLDMEGKVQKPKKDYDKPAVQKNKLEEAKVLFEKAKAIMKEYDMGESNEELELAKDKPEKEEPETMDVEANKGDSGLQSSKEAVEVEIEDEDEEKKEDEDKKDDKDEVSKMYESLKAEIESESKTERLSTIGVAQSNSSNKNTKMESVGQNNVIKEYLNKVGAFR